MTRRARTRINRGLRGITDDQLLSIIEEVKTDQVKGLNLYGNRITNMMDARQLPTCLEIIQV